MQKSVQVAVIDEQAVKIPANPIIKEITACAIPLPAQFPLGGGWAAAGCSLLLCARSRARARGARTCWWGGLLQMVLGFMPEWQRQVARLNGGASRTPDSGRHSVNGCTSHCRTPE